MRSSIAVSFTARRRNRPFRGCAARIAFSAFAVAGILAASAGVVAAQEPVVQEPVTQAPPAMETAAGEQAAQDQARPHRRWELVIPSGTVIPLGAQGDALRRGGMSALQLAYVADPRLAFTATLGWARSRDIASDGDPKLDVFTYDVGVELRAPDLLSRGMLTFTPFAGAGAGARSYNYRHLDVDATHNPAAYGSIGGDVGIGRVHVRVEARDYLSGFAPLDGAGDSELRNDVALLFGLHFAAR